VDGVGKVIGYIGFARGPENFEVTLLYPVMEPVELHIDGAWLLVDGVIGALVVELSV
jgi:hypothetical protein